MGEFSLGLPLAGMGIAGVFLLLTIFYLLISILGRSGNKKD
jgi:Na+-transporting methylmalonyl-CoA/oxaloacetate decarboxylase gamma subunit